MYVSLLNKQKKSKIIIEWCENHFAERMNLNIKMLEILLLNNKTKKKYFSRLERKRSVNFTFQ